MQISYPKLLTSHDEQFAKFAQFGIQLPLVYKAYPVLQALQISCPYVFTEHSAQNGILAQLGKQIKPETLSAYPGPHPLHNTYPSG